MAVAVAGANVPDMKLVEPTLSSLIVEPSAPTEAAPQHLCEDAGYDYQAVYDTLAQWGYTAHLRSRSDEAQERQEIPGYRARRWVVERTHSWMNRFRRLLTRWEKKCENYLALVHFACAWVAFHASGLFG
jgi:transposase